MCCTTFYELKSRRNRSELDRRRWYGRGPTGPKIRPWTTRTATGHESAVIEPSHFWFAGVSSLSGHLLIIMRQEGIRRLHLRGEATIFKGLLLHAVPFILCLDMRQSFTSATPQVYKDLPRLPRTEALSRA